MARIARLIRLAAGHARSLRGRCPACNSEGAAPHGCAVCHGHAGPFPAPPETRARWMARFERAVPAPALGGAPLAAAALAAERS